MEVIQKAIQLVDDGHVEEAMSILENYIPSANDDETFSIVQLYMEWGFFEQASETLNELVDMYPDESELKVLLAEIYIELKKDEQALSLLTQIDSDDPIYLQGLLQQADLYQSQGLYEVAELKLMDAKGLAPEELVIDFALGELLFSIGEYNRAVTFFEKVLKETDEFADVNLLERLAESLAALGKYEESFLYYEELASDHPDTLFKHGLIANYAKRTKVSIQVWNKLIQIDPYYHTVYTELGKAYREEGLLEEALNAVEKGIELDNHNKELYLLSGQILYSLNKPNEAEQHIRKAIELDSDYNEAITFLIDILNQQQAFDTIIQLLNTIKETGATDPHYDWELARTYNELESYESALKFYNEASKHLLHDSSFLKEFGYFLTEEGRVQEAIDILKRYIALAPLDNDTETFLERLLRSSND